MTIYSSLTDDSFETIRDRYAEKAMPNSKRTSQIVVEFLRDFSRSTTRIIHDKAYLEGLLHQARNTPGRGDAHTAQGVRKVGFIQTA